MHYKFLHSEDVDRVLKDGTLIVSSFEYFRRLEEKRKPWIGDRLEGATELTLPQQFNITEDSPELRIINQTNVGLGMFKQFAQVSGGGRIEMGGTRFVHQVPNMHIYSWSHGELDDLKKRMCVDSPEPYSACLRIDDPETLMKAILDQGSQLQTNVAARSMFQGVAWRSVDYDDVTRDILSGPVISPSPFMKARFFAPQCEHRMVFVPVEQSLPDRITIRLPEPTRYFHEVFRDSRN